MEACNACAFLRHSFNYKSFCFRSSKCFQRSNPVVLCVWRPLSGFVNSWLKIVVHCQHLEIRCCRVSFVPPVPLVVQTGCVLGAYTAGLKLLPRDTAASTVLRVVTLSVCPYVRPSVCNTRALWQNQTMYCGYFDTAQKSNHSSFLTPTVAGGRRPLPFEFALKVSPSPSKNADLDRFPLITCQP